MPEGKSFLQERMSLSGHTLKYIQTIGMVCEEMLKEKLRMKLLTEHSENAGASEENGVEIQN